MASLLKHSYMDEGIEKSILVFSNPDSRKGRYNMTVKVSFDEGVSWPESHHILLDPGSSFGYSSLTSMGEEGVGILYEGSKAHMTFQRISLADLLKGNRE